MLKLTKFTGETIYINPAILKTAEPGVDTLVILTTGERLLVRESVQDIQEQFVEYNKEIHSSRFLSAPL